MTMRAANRSSTDSRTVRYRERLIPPVWAWIVILVLTAALGAAFGVALGAIIGWIVFVFSAGTALWFLVATSPTLLVTDDELVVGRAHVQWEFVGLVATLNSSATAETRGRGADPRAFAVMRPLTASAAVTIEICDDEDPHPYWLFSTRSPRVMGECIRQARQAALDAADSQ